MLKLRHIEHNVIGISHSLMSYQTDSRSNGESYSDYLSRGAFYACDFQRDSSNLGTFMTVSINYSGTFSTMGFTANVVYSNVNLYLSCIFNRNVAFTYSEFGYVRNSSSGSNAKFYYYFNLSI